MSFVFTYCKAVCIRTSLKTSFSSFMSEGGGVEFFCVFFGLPRQKQMMIFIVLTTENVTCVCE